ncbi:MAG TPA: efflux RND transporter permease subunit [Acidobacteriota bacterium]|nr:efflux RND transporter permease subunit [Acidobacteriota bacterium]
MNLLDRIIRFCLTQKLIVVLLLIVLLGGGLYTAPFDWRIGGFPRDPVPVDAIPDIGENQQIVFTPWEGRSPQDVEDQITYPLTVALLGLPGVKNIRSYSFFGFSSIYVIFREDIEFYWSRSRLLEKLSSLPPETLPEGIRPQLGPDATALGQVFMYTLEGRDAQGRPTGGWDLHELRSIQDYTVRYALMAADGVAEVASVGGFVQEYQIDVDPEAMRAAGVTLPQVFSGVRSSNIDVGARTIEVNRTEYVIRGLGFIEDIDDIRETVIAVRRGNIPIRVRDVAKVQLGPALRRGMLDKGGSEVVGGIVAVRYGENPLATIANIKERIGELSLPRKTLADGTVSQVTVVPFYDRTGLIYETLGTLEEALSHEILITLIVVLVMVAHLRSGLLISALLPAGVVVSFIFMKTAGVDANIVALSGIAIAIGTMVDMGIVLSENILRHIDESSPEESRLQVVFRGASEVAGAVLTSVATTIVSFLPVFSLTAAEGKLFKPLAWTKTFALAAAFILSLAVIPPAAHFLFRRRARQAGDEDARPTSQGSIPARVRSLVRRIPGGANTLVLVLAGIVLAGSWLPLGIGTGLILNLLFVALLVGALLYGFRRFQHAYPDLLKWCLDNKSRFLAAPSALMLLGFLIWMGYSSVFFFIPQGLRTLGPLAYLQQAFPGLGREFMPSLDEGSFLYMPTTMPHASIGEAIDVVHKLDMAIASIPEVELAVGKVGRAQSPLDPAPISMIETVVNYKPEYKRDQRGELMRFRYDWWQEEFVRDQQGELIPDSGGRPYRNWRPHIQSPDDIWDEIVARTQLPGTTSAPHLQPIAARIVMLQSGMRAPMGVKVKGPDLASIEAVSLQIERFLKQVPSIKPDTVIADRIVGKPYLEIDIDRRATARYGISIQQVQDVIEVAIGGRRITTTVEGRERYPVRVRYLRELRDEIESLGQILVPTAEGAQIPLRELTEIRYVRGPQSIKSEDAELVGYVLFDKVANRAEVDVVEEARAYLDRRIEVFEEAYAELAARLGRQPLPEETQALAGLNLRGCRRPIFAGSYENQVRARQTLSVVIPLALLIILLILHLQFRSLPTTLMVFAGVAVAASGGFLMIWLYNIPWFLDIDILGTNLRQLFGIQQINLSVAVWVGFIALFGIATDDGVIMATYLKQSFERNSPGSAAEIRAAVLEAGKRRVRPCLMTTATTLLALIPVLTATGKGSDIMVPMAIPVFGGMTVALLTMFVVPTLYCAWQEHRRS